MGLSTLYYTISPPYLPPYHATAKRHQRPPSAEQSDDKRIQRPAVCGNDVQEYASILRHTPSHHIGNQRLRRMVSISLFYHSPSISLFSNTISIFNAYYTISPIQLPLATSPMASAYSLRPHLAKMFKNILQLGVHIKCCRLLIHCLHSCG